MSFIPAINRLIHISVFFQLLCNGIAAEYNCEVIKYATHCEVSNGRLRQTDSVIMRINNRAGEEYCEIELQQNKTNPISGLSAWIEDKNFTIIRYLKNKEITESNYFSSTFYTDEYVMRFTLRHNEYPYFVCYTYERSYREFLTITDWCPYIGYDVPTRNARLIVSHPENFELNILQNHTDPPSVTSESGIVRRIWMATYDGNLREETMSPRCSDYLPEIIVVPRKFTYGFAGSTESWSAFGSWIYKLNLGLDELPDSEKKIILQKISGLTDKNEIIKTLYHHLQDNTHYINVNIGIGGFKPYPASYVVQNRFGDCKALTIYMKALLKAAGINSYYVLVHAGIQPEKFYSDVPSQQFNHVILAVPAGDDTIWFENTSQSLPAGYLGSFTQNRTGLMVNEKESQLVKIPALMPYQTINSSNSDFFIDVEGNASVISRYTFRGPAFEDYCSLIDDYNSDDQNRIIHELMPFAVFDLNIWKMIRAGRDSASIMLMVSLKTQGFAGSLGQERYFSLQNLRIPEFEPPRIRKLPVQIPYPVTFADTLTYHLPDGQNFVSVPTGKTIENEFGSYRSIVTKDGTTIQIIRRFELNPVTIRLNQYNEFYNFLLSVKSEEKLKILYQ